DGGAWRPARLSVATAAFLAAAGAHGPSDSPAGAVPAGAKATEYRTSGPGPSLRISVALPPGSMSANPPFTVRRPQVPASAERTVAAPSVTIVTVMPGCWVRPVVPPGSTLMRGTSIPVGPLVWRSKGSLGVRLGKRLPSLA